MLLNGSQSAVASRFSWAGDSALAMRDLLLRKVKARATGLTAATAEPYGSVQDQFELHSERVDCDAAGFFIYNSDNLQVANQDGGIRLTKLQQSKPSKASLPQEERAGQPTDRLPTLSSLQLHEGDIPGVLTI